MVTLDYYTSVGHILELLAQSDYHARQTTGDYFRVEVLPALRCGQTRLFFRDDGRPSAVITWAWLSEDVERDVLSSGRALGHDEWRSGTRLFFNDWITPYGNIREVVHEMTHIQFPDEVATSLRRNPDGTVRRVNRWTGAHVRKTKDEVTA